MNPGAVLSDERLVELRYSDLAARRTTAQAPLPFWRGSGMGGSSTVNGILAIRALPEDHDEWRLDGWGWDDMLPCYRRLEREVDHPTIRGTGRRAAAVMRMPRRRWGSWMPRWRRLPTPPDTAGARTTTRRPVRASRPTRPTATR